MLESLFSWASLQMDTIAVTLTDVDYDGVTAEVAHGAAEAAADKGLKLEASCGGIVVQAQRDMLITVLRNLIGNAVKFTLPGGTISVWGRRDRDEVEISVTDTGVGMPPGKVDDLFRLDRRTTTNGTAGERGSGLGLLLCRDLAERQGSILTVRSSPGRGTTFNFRLPEAAAARATATRSTARVERNAETTRTHDDTPTAVPSPAKPGRNRGSVGGL